MGFSSFVFLLFGIFAVFLGLRVNKEQQSSVTPIFDFASSLNRSSFPSDFIFGTSSSAYSVEGAANEDGKGPSIWDIYTHKYPDKIDDRSNADVAIDAYHRYKEDIGTMKQMNFDAYKFSISWSRILPKGKLSGGINQEGIKYYNNLINELLANGLKPFVTLYHWDLPQALEDEYGGFLSPSIVKDFEDYVELCFKEFGDRVKNWITMHETYSFSMAGYAVGILAPGRCSDWQNMNCNGGDSGTEPYLVGHHLLLSHAAAVKVYRTKYQASQKGMIGMSLVSHWFIPYSDEEADQEAAKRALDFMLGWFMDPLTEGEYPKSMRNLVGERLPEFTEEESKLIKGSFDFVGIDYYTSLYAAHAPHLSITGPAPSLLTDSLVNLTTERNGRPIGTRAASDWLYIYPRGVRELLLHVKTNYNNPLIYITETGVDEFNDPTLSLEEALMDIHRIDFFYRHLYYVQTAARDGVNVKGYFAWCLADSYEWPNGFTLRYGMNFVDHENALKRHQKLSAQWFQNFLRK